MPQVNAWMKLLARAQDGTFQPYWTDPQTTRPVKVSLPGQGGSSRSEQVLVLWIQDSKTLLFFGFQAGA
jgi:hypothetical protein